MKRHVELELRRDILIISQDLLAVAREVRRLVEWLVKVLPVKEES